MNRSRIAVAAVAGMLVLVAASAAHVTVNPNEVPADSFARFAIRVPNERPNASTTKVTVRLPRGLFFVSFQPKAGWTRTMTTEKLDPPAVVFGEQVTERVATVTWAGGTIAPGEFDEFGLSAKVPDAPGSALVFPAIQTYSNGEVVRWIGPRGSDTPASRVTLGAKAEAAPTTTTTADEEEDEGDDESATLALAFGIAGLVAGVAALAVSLFRRPRRA